MPISRRNLLKGAAAAGGLLAVSGRSALARSALTLPRTTSDLGLNTNAPVDTIVVVMMENRSFDHFLGWYDTATVARDQIYLDAAGTEHATRLWAPDYQGCGYGDPGHNWAEGRAQLGAERGARGFMQPGSGNDDYALGYYDAADIPVWEALTKNATIFDQYFAAVLGPTYPNRWYQHGATSGGRIKNDLPTGPDGYADTTIWDLLEAKGLTWAYYYSNLPFIAMYGNRLTAKGAPNIRHVSSYYADAAAGLLPNVCFIDPFFTVEGLANDDHPHADIRLGQQFLADVIGSFTESPQYRSGALFVNYDEWGGFFDSVIPEAAPGDDRKTGSLETDFSQRGFRTPACVVSPYARRGEVASGTYDHTSILKFIEWRFGLDALTARDASANNIGEALDFAQAPNLDPVVPAYTAPPEARILCDAKGIVPSDFAELRDSGLTDALGLRTDYRFADSYRSF